VSAQSYSGDRVGDDRSTSRGFSIGARAAYAWPFGDVLDPPTGDAKMSDAFDRMIPIWIDATLRLGGGLEIGPYFSYGWVAGGGGAGDFGDAKDYRLGAQLNYRLTPAGGFAPWIGVGAGWEWLKPDNDVFGRSADLSGLELMVQGGADFRLGPNLALGPFVALSVGRFSSGDVFDLPGVDKAWHEWVQVGAKLTFDL
jgi:hypothetical protein